MTRTAGATARWQVLASATASGSASALSQAGHRAPALARAERATDLEPQARPRGPGGACTQYPPDSPVASPTPRRCNRPVMLLSHGTIPVPSPLELRVHMGVDLCKQPLAAPQFFLEYTS